MTPTVGTNVLRAVSERSESSNAIRKKNTKANSITKVLEEEDFVERVEMIIERDFFPYLDKVRKHTELLDALESRDSVRIAEAERRLIKTPKPAEGGLVPPVDTPSKEEWDDEDWVNNGHCEVTPNESARSGKSFKKEDKLKEELSGISLNQFMAQNTSEDNQSFKQIMCVEEERRRKKLDWVYKHEQESRSLPITSDDSKLMPPPASAPLALIEEKSGSNDLLVPLDGWKYRVHNSVMFYPEGVSRTDDELRLARESQVKVEHSSTRLHVKPWRAPLTRNKIAPGAAPAAVPNEILKCRGAGVWNGIINKIGIDGKQCWEDAPAAAPKVNGFDFVATPSPRPGVGESPLMTWGQIDSTPYLLDPASECSKFRLKEPSVREKLAHSLAEQTMAQKRKQQHQCATPGHDAGGIGMPQSPRFTALSPAAKRLAVGKLGISRGVDTHLTASYTPSPARQRATQTAQSISSTSVPAAPSPFPSPSLPQTAPGSAKTELGRRSTHVPLIRKRPKASDFF